MVVPGTENGHLSFLGGQWLISANRFADLRDFQFLR